MKKCQTVHGEAWIDLNEIIAIMPQIARDSNPYILLRCGEKIYFDRYNLQLIKNSLDQL